MTTSKRKWVGAGLGVGTLVLFSAGGVAAMALPASAATISVVSPTPAVTEPGIEDGSKDGETADDQTGEVPGQEIADDQVVEDGTHDGETADDPTTAPAN
ncbi:hypothetical protein [Microbacterium sp.]|uniref:hypothetical protein n=1 Tax=Microbacterium TaxID=33882 RepID=UPI0032429919